MSVFLRQQRTEWFYGMVFFLLALLLLGFYAWLKYFDLASLSNKLDTERGAIAELKTQQNDLLDADLRLMLEQYSEQVKAVESVLVARDEVFTGSLSDDQFEPVVLLDIVQFIALLTDLLSRKVILSHFSLGPTGELSFLVQTTSFREAARQMEVLRMGFSGSRQKQVVMKEVQEGDVGESAFGEELPPLIINVVISSVVRSPLSGSLEEIPEVLRSGDSSYDFIVRMQINPQYFFALHEEQKESDEQAK